MSAATIDRYLKEERQRLELRGIGATKRGALLRNSIQIRTATQEVEAEPGFFEIDTVAHCGPTLKGEFARTLSMTDVHTGWIHLEVCRNNAQTHILAALNRAAQAIPFMIQGIDCDNGSEFINHEVLKWATDLDIFFTRSRPYQKNDQANIESKNNHVVRRYGFHYRYDTEEERQLLAALWQVVCLKMNFFTPTRTPIGWRQNPQRQTHTHLRQASNPLPTPPRCRYSLNQPKTPPRPHLQKDQPRRTYPRNPALPRPPDVYRPRTHRSPHHQSLRPTTTPQTTTPKRNHHPHRITPTTRPKT